MTDMGHEPSGLEERLAKLAATQPRIQVAEGFEVEVDLEYFTDPDQPE